ncbi:MAG: 4-hydroxybutyrate dehydrogenase [Ruminiclostridium sp.]|nr:4-hydroxybutyrate dehydrogenase [Ruminiclostridium sp.]
MTQFSVKPAIQLCDTVKEFAEAVSLGPKDLLFTNDFLYDPYFAPLGLKCPVLFQEKYGLGEPTDEMVEAIYADMPKDVERIVAVGGGTVLDVAKILSLKHVSPVLDLYDGKVPVEKGKELVLVPTTCGTGTEVTNISILALISRRTKKGLANDSMYADQAVMIPELLKGLPFKFFATSSIDALIHAIESSLSPKANGMTKLFGRKAIEMILKGYMVIRDKGPEARFELLGDFLLASNYAGIAFGNAGCAAVHALAYPLGAAYHVPHGESNYAVFTGVMNMYMSIRSDGAIAELNQFMAEILGCDVANIYGAMEDLLNCLLPKKALKEYGMTEEEIETFADSVVENQQRLLGNNFVPLSRDQIRDIYRAVY